MDPLLILEVIHNTPLLVPPQPYTPISHLGFPGSPLQPQNHSQQIRCHTANVENRPILQMHIQMSIEWQGTPP